MNDVVYHISSFMMVRNPYTWRWSHARHHTDTYIIGRDPELLMMRPPALVSIVINFFGLIDAYNGWARMCLHASGKLHPEEACYVPESEAKKVIHVARVWVLIYAATCALALVLGSILPLMVIGLPRLYGAWHHVMTGVLQHGGLAEDVLDHRLNTRTVYMNRISRFIYLDMNYHVEHHMFPMVPYYRLAKLHALIKDDLPAPSPSIYAAFKEMIPVLRRQVTDHDFFLKRELPASAQPYRDAFHTVLP